MRLITRLWVGLGTLALAGSVSGCIAPDVIIIGAVGLTVTESGEPVLVIEPCDGEAARVTLSHSREGLAPNEENEYLVRWTASPAQAERSELVIHDVQAPWRGPSFTMEAGRGYVADGAGTGKKDVLTQVAFRADDLAGFDPGTVYINDVDPDSTSMLALSAAEFSQWACAEGESRPVPSGS